MYVQALFELSQKKKKNEGKAMKTLFRNLCFVLNQTSMVSTIFVKYTRTYVCTFDLKSEPSVLCKKKKKNM